jgi:hypothetical protein
MPDMPLKAPFLPRGEVNKTLWIFGAGASAHLGFPLSWGFLRSTVSLVTSFFKDPNDLSLDFGRSFRPKDFTTSAGSPITNDDVRAIKTDPVKAFDLIDLWTYTEPADRKDLVRLQYLVRELKALKKRLADVGITPATGELLGIAPEELIRQIRELKAQDIQSKIGRGRDLEQVQFDIQKAQECVSLIYFYALSEFNEAARSKVTQDSTNSCYDQLVRSFVFEKDSRIISFNYDTMLDESLFWRFTKAWAYERIHLAAINGYPVSAGAEADLLYIKPHGSLNMLVCPNCQRTHIQWFARFVPRGGGKPASDNRRCAHCKDVLPGRKELLDGLVVPPLYDKEVIEGSKGAIRRAFAWTNNIVSIGFSYPEQDAYFIDCVADGLRDNPNTKVTLWLVLRGTKGTAPLKKRLEADSRLAPYIGNLLQIEATDVDGFEAV